MVRNLLKQILPNSFITFRVSKIQYIGSDIRSKFMIQETPAISKESSKTSNPGVFQMLNHMVYLHDVIDCLKNEPIARNPTL